MRHCNIGGALCPSDGVIRTVNGSTYTIKTCQRRCRGHRRRPGRLRRADQCVVPPSFDCISSIAQPIRIHPLNPSRSPRANIASAVIAARAACMPSVVSFTVETDGRLPTGQPLGEAIEQVDEGSLSGAAYFMINCAHPDHFTHVLKDGDWARRIRGIRCNASRKSYAELDESETLDHGCPTELGKQYRKIRELMPWLNIFGGCCGADLRHVTQVADALKL